MEWETTIPDTIAYLLTLWQASIVGAEISDGQPVGGEGSGLFLMVGFDGQDGSVTGEVRVEGMAGDPNREEYTVHCAAVATSGDADPGIRRTSAFGLFKSACAALAADRTLGGLVLTAVPTTITVNQIPSDQGGECWVIFGVSVDAFTKN